MTHYNHPDRSTITEEPYETGTVTRVDEHSLTWNHGFSLGYCPDIPVEIGDPVEMWGKGVGYRVRGLATNGFVHWYRTEAEQDEYERLETRRRAERQVEQYVEHKAELDAAYEALPPVFRARIDRFRAGCPEFRWQYEPYEMSVCTDAVHIAEWAERDPDRVMAFRDMDDAEQRAAVRDLYDGHSGNSFAFAVRLAWLYCDSPDLVAKEHGALTPLVGCDAYGCTHP